MTRKRLNFILYFIISLTLSVGFLRNPYYNWDMIPYSALALQLNGYPKQDIHDEAYFQIKEAVAPEVFYALTDPNNKYRTDVYQYSEKLDTELMFYTVKPLYVGSVAFFYLIGFNIALATVLPSIFSYFIISLLLFTWLRKYSGDLIAGLFSLLFMCCPFMLDTALLSTPDMLCCLLLLTGFYYFVICSKPKLSLVFFILALLTRPDVCLFVSLLYLWGFKVKKISLKLVLTTVILVFGLAYILILVTAFPLNSTVLSVQTQERLVLNYEQIPIKRYLESYIHGFDNLKYNYIVEYFLGVFISILLNLLLRKRRIKNELTFIPLFLTLHFVAFYILHPFLNDRFFVFDYLICYSILFYQIVTLIKNSEAMKHMKFSKEYL